MKQVKITKKLLTYFKSEGKTLILEGYCKNFTDVTLYTDGEQYAAAVRQNGVWELCSPLGGIKFVSALACELGGKVKFCAVNEEVSEYLQNNYKPEFVTPCDLYVWNKLPLQYENKKEVQAMQPRFSQMISDGTHYHASLNDILKCLAMHPSSAVYENEKPVCWCLLHQEGSLGMLYTLPEHRRKGLALEVMTDLCRKVIKLGNVPFCYIVADNFPSKSLAEKYNMEYVCRADYLEIDFNDPVNVR